MALEVFSEIPWGGARFVDSFEGHEGALEDGPGEERVYVACGLARRTYTWPFGRYPEEMSVVAAFARARQLAAQAFLVRDPWEHRREAQALGSTAVGVVTYSLLDDWSGDAHRDYAKPGTLSVAVGPWQARVVSEDRDARTFTLDPTTYDALSPLPIVASYDFYRLVRFAPAIPWDAPDAGWYTVGLELREVFRTHR